MVKSAARSAEEYLSGLPADKRAVVGAVRDLILENLPKGYQESVEWGMLTYEIPLARYPDTYNKRPLPFVCLAGQKHYCSLYLMSVYQDTQAERDLRKAFTRAGKTLDMGMSCVRFRRPEDLALDAIAKLVAATPPEAHIAQYEAARKRSAKAKATQATTSTKAPRTTKATKAMKATKATKATKAR